MARSCIYAKDVSIITGKGERTSRHYFQTMKKKLGKKVNQFVTIHEFANYSGIPITVVREQLRI